MDSERSSMAQFLFALVQATHKFQIRENSAHMILTFDSNDDKFLGSLNHNRLLKTCRMKIDDE